MGFDFTLVGDQIKFVSTETLLTIQTTAVACVLQSQIDMDSQS